MPSIHRGVIEPVSFIAPEIAKDVEMLVNGTLDYALYERLFSLEYLQGLLQEMIWVEKNYQFKSDRTKSKLQLDDQNLSYYAIGEVFQLE